MPVLKLISSDKIEMEIDSDIMNCSGTITRMLIDCGLTDECVEEEEYGMIPKKKKRSSPIKVPLSNVHSIVLKKILEWATHHYYKTEHRKMVIKESSLKSAVADAFAALSMSTRTAFQEGVDSVLSFSVADSVKVNCPSGELNSNSNSTGTSTSLHTTTPLNIAKSVKTFCKDKTGCLISNTGAFWPGTTIHEKFFPKNYNADDEYAEDDANYAAAVAAEANENVNSWMENPTTTTTTTNDQKNIGMNNKSIDRIPKWDLAFLNVDQAALYDIILAANYLDIPLLLEYACKSVARMIKGKTSEGIRQLFNIRNDFSDLERDVIQQESQELCIK